MLQKRFDSPEEKAKAEWMFGEVFYEPVEEEGYSGKKYDGWNHDEGPYSWSEYLEFYDTEEEAKERWASSTREKQGSNSGKTSEAGNLI